MVMKHSQDVLEKAETVDVLVAVVTVIHSLAMTHQHLFADYFKVFYFRIGIYYLIGMCLYTQ